MTLKSGARIGPYEILSMLGAGAMGEVYRARDTRLSRIVAIKVLGDGADGQSKASQRFAQEARVLSGLNHPHICGFCDIGDENGVHFLVMEYLEGETLASRLRRGQTLPIDQALRYAIEIADALDHAHRCGLVHRDLKPSNIMLTRSGAKLLDFGLAKREAAGAIVGNSRDGPLSTQSLTADGAILGTPSYMAPEQLHGAEADVRTDIFAFGQVVYEMLNGRRAFEGPSQASVIAAILEHDPVPFSSGDAIAPPMLESIVMRCLAKTPDERWQTASDLRQALTWIAEGATQMTGISDAARLRRSALRRAWLTGLFAVIAAVTTTALILTLFRRGLPDVDAIRFVISAPEGASFTQSSAFMALSPDGRSLAFVTSSQGGKLSLWIRSLDSLTAREIATDAVQPFWSPDSRFVGFYVRGKLKKIDAMGGVAQTLADSWSQPGAWSRDGVILFRPKSDGGLSQIPAAGGPAAAVTDLDHSLGETAHEWPQFLPDGRHFLYLARSTQPEHDSVLYLASLDSRDRVRLFKSDSQATYAPPGFLISMLGNALLAQPFDASRFRVTGEPIAIADHVERNPDSHRGAFSVSQTGVLAYRPTGDTELVWFARTGQRMEKVGTPGRYSNPALSPDSRQVAVARVDPETGTTDIWLYELARAVASRFTFDPASDDMPLWTPDGSHIVFKSGRNGAFAFYRRASSGSGPDEVMLSGLGPGATPLSWSPDGRFLVFGATGGPQRSALWLLPSFGDRKPFPYLQAPVNELQGQVSPDGRWMAYTSIESGRNEVYVRPFPSGEGRWQISTSGGLEPTWRGDGRELFFLAVNQDLMAVAIKPGSISDAGAPTRLFGTAMSGGTIMTTYTRNQYVVAADGQRFLINQGAGGVPTSPVTVVVNWTSALRK